MVPDQGFVTAMRQMTPNPFGDFIGYTDPAIWQAITHKRDQEQAGTADDPADVKQPEWAIFATPGQQPTSSDFRLCEVAVPAGFEHQIARVVLVERLREVRALIGFTRIDAPAIADAHLLFVSSANLTDYALNLNMELGVLIAGGSQPQTVVAQFDALIAQGILQRVKA